MSQLQYGFFIVSVLLILLVIVEESNSKEHTPNPKKRIRCPPRRYGPGCLLRCSVGCRTCDGDGVCLQCVGQYRPPTCRRCKGGYFGQRCEKTCTGCDDCHEITGECWECREPGLALPNCVSSCPHGSYGQHCTKRCPLSCAESCNVRTGKCKECMHGTGASCRVDCSKAGDKYACKLYCPPKCEGICNATNGHCQDCAAGYTSLKCDKTCEDGFYGKNCRDACPKYCKAGNCDSVTGLCAACESGHIGKECESEVQCKSGFFGKKCSKPCPHTCAEGKCDPDTGECVSCYSGYSGPFCSEPCQNGSYGVNCRHKCSANCEGVCTSKTGKCWGCVSGFLGNFCNRTCDVGTFGVKCSSRCSELCKDERCDPVDGHCFECPPKRNGTFCADVYVKEKGLYTIPIVAVYITIGTMLPVFIVTIPMCIYRRYLRREIMRQEKRKVMTMTETIITPSGTVLQSPTKPILHTADKNRPIMRNEVSFKDIYLKLRDDKFTDFSVKSTTRSEVSRNTRHVKYNRTEVISSIQGSRDSHLFPSITFTDKTGSITSVNFCKSQDNSMHCLLPGCSDQVTSGRMGSLPFSSHDNKMVIPHKSVSNTCIHDGSDSDSDVTLTTVEGAEQYRYKQGRSYLLSDDKLFKNGRIYKLSSQQQEDDDTQPYSSSDSHAHIHTSSHSDPSYDTARKEATTIAEFPRELPDFGRGLNIERCVLCDDPPVLRNKHSSNTEQNRSKYSLKHSRSSEEDNIQSKHLRKTVSFFHYKPHTCLDQNYKPHTCLDSISEENRGFTPELPKLGFTPELHKRGFTPELHKRGFTPELDKRGFTPELDKRGFKPELHKRGFTPELPKRGFIPELDKRGFTPELPKRGFIPELDKRGFTPELDKRGFTPELHKRGTTPELHKRGFTPELDKRGFTPELDKRGFTPELDEIHKRGFTPELHKRGFTPELDKRGFTTELDKCCFTPELDERGITPELDERGITPELVTQVFTPESNGRGVTMERQAPDCVKGLQNNKMSETDTSQWSHETLALPSSNPSKRTKSAPALPPRSPSTRLLSKSHQGDTTTRIEVKGLPPLSSTPILSHFYSEIAEVSNRGVSNGGGLSQTSPPAKTSQSLGKIDSGTDNVVYDTIQLPSLTDQASPTHIHSNPRVRAALPKEVIDELQAGFTKFSALMQQVSPHYDTNNDTHDCDAVQEPTVLANSLSYLRYVQNPTNSRSRPEQQSPVTPHGQTSSHAVAVSNDTVAWKRNNDVCEKSHHHHVTSDASPDSCRYSLCSSCEDQISNTKKQEQATSHTAYENEYEENTLPVKYSHYRPEPAEQEDINSMFMAGTDSTEHDGNAIRYSQYPSTSSCNKEASFHIVKGRSPPVFRQPSARQRSPHAKSSAAKLGINTDETLMSPTGSVPKVSMCKLPSGRPPPPPPPPRTSSTLRSSSTCSDQRTTSLASKSPRPLPVPSPERMLQLQLEAEGLGKSRSEHSKSTCRSEDFTDAKSCQEAEAKAPNAQTTTQLDVDTLEAPPVSSNNAGVNDVCIEELTLECLDNSLDNGDVFIEQDDDEGHELHPYRSYVD